MGKKHILITGSHRSGSTWTGRVICSSNKFVYVDEPFNIGKQHKGIPFKNQFEYLNQRSGKEQRRAKQYLNAYYSLFHKEFLFRLIRIRSFKDVRRSLSNLKSRMTRRYVFKDPLALLSAEWIYQNYDWEVVVLVRHPAAFVASLKVKDWQFDFNYFRRQQDLVQTHLSEYSEKIEEYASKQPDIIQQGILLWNILYTMVCYYRRKYKNKWYFVSHEDLSARPIEEFEKLYKFLRIEFNDEARNFLEASTSSKEESLLKRDSRKNIKSWKKRLSRSEIDLINRETEKVWKNFYTEEDW